MSHAISESQDSTPARATPDEPAPGETMPVADAPVETVPLEAPSKRITRIFLKFSLTSASFGLVTCLALGILIAVHLEDEAPFADSDLRSMSDPILPGQNAGPGIRKAMTSLDGLYFYETKNSVGTPFATALAQEQFGSFSLGAPPAPLGDRSSWEASPVRGMVENALAEHADFYAQIDAACALPACRFPEPSHALEGIDQWYSRSRQAWQLVQLRSDAAFARGDLAATVAADLGQLRYAALYHHGSHTIVQKIGTLAQLRIALMTVARHFDAGAFAGREADLAATLNWIDLDRTSATRAIQTEYRLFRSMVFEAPDMLDESEVSARGVSFLFHPYETLRTLGEYYRTAILEGESTGRVVEAEPPKIATGWVMKLLKGNGLGHSLLEMAQLELDSIYLRTEEVVLEIAALRERVSTP